MSVVFSQRSALGEINMSNSYLNSIIFVFKGWRERGRRPASHFSHIANRIKSLESRVIGSLTVREAVADRVSDRPDRAVPAVFVASAVKRRLAIPSPGKDNCRTVFVSRVSLPTPGPQG
jgi:hypothetical protein